MSSPTVTVIVPVYNVEPYLTQCLDSLVLQDLSEIEIIVVNDGTQDSSAQIAARYAMADSRLKVIHQENRGLSAARNAGLAEARGTFIGFVDGDDWVHPDMYLAMSQKADDSGADLVITNGFLYDDQSKAIRPIQDGWVWEKLRARADPSTVDPRLAPDLFILDTSACKRLYRRTFLNRLGFAFMEGKIFEDVVAHYRLLLNSNSVALVDRKYYYYRTNRPGRITARSDATLLQIFDVMQEVVSDLEKCSADNAIWANYIWFQNWVLRWLREQISPDHLKQFDSRSRIIAARFPQQAIAEFGAKFMHDPQAIQFVDNQVSVSMNHEGVVVHPQESASPHPRP